ncbi:MAG: SDR family oxidoreductase [Actinomycetota bacterium]
MDIARKRALVFGGTSGIGLATTLALAERGASVLAISRNPSKAGELPDTVSMLACDVTDEAAVAALVTQAGPYEILISAATGGERALGPFVEMAMDGYRGSFDKLWGYANVVRHGAHHLTEDGTIVLVSGTPARRAKPGQAALGSVGAAVEQLVRTVAPEIAPKRINVVSPGIIDTPMVPLAGEERAAHYAAVTAGHAIPRAGTPEEVAEAVLFCVTNEFVTGTTIDVDGGWLLS